MTKNSRAGIVSRRALASPVEAVAGRIRRERKPQETPASRIVTLGQVDGVMNTMLRGMRPVVDAFRGGDNLHVSDVLKKCLRQIALVKSMDARPAGRKLRDSEVITFRQGDAIHDFVKQRFVDNHSSSVFGKWACVCGKKVTSPMLHSQVHDKHTCEVCGVVPYRYVEVPIIDKEYGLVGNPDLLLYLSQYSAYHVTEIKSMNKDQFEELLRPVPDHILQVTFYWHLMKRAGRRLTDRPSILYVNKAWSFKNPYKEFLVDAVAAEKRLRPYIEDLMQLNAYVGGEDGAELPPRTCPKVDSPAAKDCPVRVRCFQ